MSASKIGCGVILAMALASACGGESSSDPGTGGTGGSAGTGGSSGAGTGGSSGIGGSSGTGGSSGSGTSPGVVGECKEDIDCELVSTCCDCVAGKKGSVIVPACPEIPCAQDACSSLGVATARCLAGQCTIAANCDVNQATCKSLPPQCPPGQTITVNAFGCWGPCVDFTSCARVESCFVCPEENGCVVNDAWESSHHCVNLPPNCSGCACLGPLACVGGFTECGEFDDGSSVHCACPSC